MPLEARVWLEGVELLPTVISQAVSLTHRREQLDVVEFFLVPAFERFGKAVLPW